MDKEVDNYAAYDIDTPIKIPHSLCILYPIPSIIYDVHVYDAGNNTDRDCPYGSVVQGVTLTMLRVLSSNAQRCKHF